ncbi:hypothetical protein [Mycobacterium simiae]|uniref:hypothetical protein n=1 Tax=Mycobacterium simiae TaxID=1784 RepID=UPI00260E3707|nr:hypothetical protein [Mycobacterium simiae]
MSESASSSGVSERVVHKVNNAVLAGARRWAWANPAVPIAVAGVAIAGYLVRRVGGHRRLATALDSTVVNAGAVLDPDPADEASLRHPVRKARHAIVNRLTRGAIARRRSQ